MNISRDTFNHLLSVVHYTAAENARLVVLFKEVLHANVDQHLLRMLDSHVNSFTFSHVADTLIQTF